MRPTAPIAGRMVRFGVMNVAGGPFACCWSRRCKSFSRMWFGTSAGGAEERLPTTPPFALPHRRYVKQAVLACSAEYLGNDKASYRTVARGALLPYGYETKPGMPMDNRQLSPSTVWRWVAWLGNMRATLQAAYRLIRQKAPQSPLPRQTWAFPPRKYRSKQRARQLARAARMVLAEHVFRRLFATEMFPNFGTAHGFG